MSKSFNRLFGRLKRSSDVLPEPPRPIPPPEPRRPTPPPVVEPEFLAPTSKQLNFARKLGLTVPPGVSRYELSEIIGAAAPTTKQLNYARKLGLAVPPGVSRDELGAMLGAAEAANPKLREDRERVNERKRIETYGPELIAQEQHWQTLADDDKWLVAVYKSGKSIKAGVFRMNGAHIDDKGKIRIETEVGKVARDAYIGECVDTGRAVEIKLDSLLWSDVVEHFEIEDVERFKLTLQRVERMASVYE